MASIYGSAIIRKEAVSRDVDARALHAAAHYLEWLKQGYDDTQATLAEVQREREEARAEVTRLTAEAKTFHYHHEAHTRDMLDLLEARTRIKDYEKETLSIYDQRDAARAEVLILQRQIETAQCILREKRI